MSMTWPDTWNGPARPPLVRPTGGRRLAGVAGGVADHLGLPSKVVRIAFVVAALAGGPGVVLYVWLWAFVPAERRTVGRPGVPVAVPVQPLPWLPGTAGLSGPPGPSGPSGPSGPTGPLGPPGQSVPFGAPRSSGTPGLTSSLGAPGRPGPAPGASIPGAGHAGVDDEADRPSRIRARPDLLAGLFLVIAGVALAGSQLGWGVKPGLAIPILIVAAGAVLAYAQLDEVDRARWFARTGVGTRAATLRLALGLVLVVLGILLLVVQQTDVVLLTQTLLAAIAVLTGVAVVLAPWGIRLWRDLGSERAARARESERADIAAHLHDSVLQTLALIQRRSGDGAEVARLARAQERDLRSWLYGGGTGDPSTVSARVAALAAEAEDLHGVVVEVVTVGDRPVDERTEPLLAALREAVANAARHAGGSIQVYVEFGPGGVEAYVKDRGPGFELAEVDDDRLGVRESIIGRMERHGGRARVISTPGSGTEVRLSMPDEEVVS